MGQGRRGRGEGCEDGTALQAGGEEHLHGGEGAQRAREFHDKWREEWSQARRGAR